jgi:hypothetical protein
MVSKLLLATAETFARARENHADEVIRGKLADHYYSVRAGIGLNKSPDLYGAFPTDPYSHTPRQSGAKQPGMTGQVKEDILARWYELGVLVVDGCLTFRPSLLRESEFLGEQATAGYYDVDGGEGRIEAAPGELVFTYCQVPIVYRIEETDQISVFMRDGTVRRVDGASLDSGLSREVFGRTGRIERIEVGVRPGLRG